MSEFTLNYNVDILLGKIHGYVCLVQIEIETLFAFFDKAWDDFYDRSIRSLVLRQAFGEWLLQKSETRTVVGFIRYTLWYPYYSSVLKFSTFKHHLPGVEGRMREDFPGNWETLPSELPWNFILFYSRGGTMKSGTEIEGWVRVSYKWNFRIIGYAR